MADTNGNGRNVIIFVADGLRNGSVNPIDTPTLYSVRQQGVSFAAIHYFPHLPPRMLLRSQLGIILAIQVTLATLFTLVFLVLMLMVLSHHSLKMMQFWGISMKSFPVTTF